MEFSDDYFRSWQPVAREWEENSRYGCGEGYVTGWCMISEKKNLHSLSVIVWSGFDN